MFDYENWYIPSFYYVFWRRRKKRNQGRWGLGVRPNNSIPSQFFKGSQVDSLCLKSNKSNRPPTNPRFKAIKKPSCGAEKASLSLSLQAVQCPLHLSQAAGSKNTKRCVYACLFFNGGPSRTQRCVVLMFNTYF